MKIILGQEVIVDCHGLGRVTSIGPDFDCGGVVKPKYIGVTPYVANFEMKFDPNNVELIDPRK